MGHIDGGVYYFSLAVGLDDAGNASRPVRDPFPFVRDRFDALPVAADRSHEYGEKR